MLFTLVSLSGGAVTAGSSIQPTPAPNGPYHVNGNRILDSEGRPYLIRGTQLPAFTGNPSEISGSGLEFGAFSMTTLATIRQRLNMNAVRLPLIPQKYEGDPLYRTRAEEIVRKANLLNLVVILAADQENHSSSETLLAFWGRCAAAFRDRPNVFFAVSAARPSSWDDLLVRAIRAAGARQPIVAGGGTADLNIIYEATASYAGMQTEREKFGLLSERAPLLVNGLDPGLDQDSEECRAFPSDPAAAARLVNANLDYFDAHHISWIISAFRPGRLITDYHFYNGTKLDSGWTCGKPPGGAGLGMVLLSHLWNSDPHGLFAVHPACGGFILPRGGMATAYGPILAEREMGSGLGPLPLVLGNISVRVADSRGVARLAPLLHTGAGWSYLSFIVPENAAPGPATVEVVRTDGSSSSAKVIIADLAAGISTASMDGRGVVKGWARQRFASGKTTDLEVSKCSVAGCAAVPIPLSPRTATTLHMEVIGLRHAGLNPAIRVVAGDVSVPVVSFGPMPDAPGRDQLQVQLPGELIGSGETDLYLVVNGLVSNIARVNCGTQR